jgi:hypothetical protein
MSNCKDVISQQKENMTTIPHDNRLTVRQGPSEALTQLGWSSVILIRCTSGKDLHR